MTEDRMDGLSVSKQVHTLTQRLSQLEQSNGTIIKRLNESESSKRDFDAKSSDVFSCLQTMKERIASRESELFSLKEEMQSLDRRVEELAQSIIFIQKTVNIANKRNDSLNNVTSTQRHSESSSRTRRKTARKLSLSSDETRNDSLSKKNGDEIIHTERRMMTTSGEDVRSVQSKQTPSRDEKSEMKKDGPNPEPVKMNHLGPNPEPVKMNHLGLRGRQISFENDNRVRLLQGKKCEEGSLQDLQCTPSSPKNKSEDKYNLPTRQEFQKKHRGKESKSETSKSRAASRTSPPQNEYKTLAGLHTTTDEATVIKDIGTWKTLAESERMQGLFNMFIQRGKGPDTCLLLDTSSSMEGKKFEEMISLAKQYVRGVAEIAMLGIPENIGIATFGEQTRVILHMTNDYDKVLQELELLTPNGPSHMAGGIYMAMACCLGHGGGISTTIIDVTVRAKVIMFTDGLDTPDSTTYDSQTFSIQTRFMRQLWLKEASEDMGRRRLRIYCVALKDTNPELLEDICKKTEGKIFKAEEISLLIKMTQNTIQAIDMIGKGVDFENMDVSLMESLSLSRLPFIRSSDMAEVARLGKFFRKENLDGETGGHVELKDSNLPPLGSRVRRGPDWEWNDQDENGPGTVVGHDKQMGVWVEWDCGHKNTYRVHPLIGYDVVVVDEPRKLEGKMIAVGCLVRRGDNWRNGNDDGGKENVGVVIEVQEIGLIFVRWPNKKIGRYKFGYDGVFEVKLCEPHKVNSRTGQLRAHVLDSGTALGGINSKPTDGATASGGESTRTSVNKQKKDSQLSVDDLNKKNNKMQRAAGVSEAEKPIESRVKKGVIAAKWLFQRGDNWEEFPDDVNMKLEKYYYRNKQGSPLFELNGVLMKAMFSTMQQECQSTKEITSIKRLERQT